MKQTQHHMTCPISLLSLMGSQVHTSWSTTVAVNRTDVSLKLDTGAEITVVSEKALKSLDVKELQSSSKDCVGHIVGL